MERGKSRRAQKKVYGKKCVCGREGECQGVSAAFKLLGDPRKGYVQLPQYQEFPSSPLARELNGLRASYLRHLKRPEQSIPDGEEPLFVALHHFHPIVVQKHSESPHSTSPIPKTLKPVDLRFLKMNLGDDDRVRDADGNLTNLFYFVPNYPIDKAKEDLKRLIRVSRMVTEAPLKKKASFKSPKGSILTLPSPKKAAHPPSVPATPPRLVFSLPNSQTPQPETLQPETPQPETPQPVKTPTVPKTPVPSGESTEESAVKVIPVIAPVPENDKKQSGSLNNVAKPDNKKVGQSSVIEVKADEKVPPAKVEKQEPIEAPKKEAETMTPTQNDVAEEKAVEIPVAKPLPEQKADQSSVPYAQKVIVELPPASDEMPEFEDGIQGIVDKMVKFELKRREEYSIKLELTASHWRGALEVMQAGIFETARAERLVKGAAIANEAYAVALQAVADDAYLDDDGNVVSDERRMHRIKNQRAKTQKSPFLLAGDSRSDDGSGMLGPVRKYQQDLSNSFEGDAQRVFDEVVAELRTLRQDLKNQLLSVKRKGDTFIRDLRGAEIEVLQAWKVYDKVGAAAVSAEMLSQSAHSVQSYQSAQAVASEVTSNPDTNGGSEKPLKTPRRHNSQKDLTLTPVDENNENQQGRPSRKKALGVDSWDVGNKRLGNSQLAAAMRSLGDFQDSWLAEWFYRIAVQHQTKVWEISSRELTKIHTKIHDSEVNRRVRLHQLLLDFMPRERRMFLGLVPMSKPVLNGLVSNLVVPEKVESQIEITVQKHMQTILKHGSARRSSIMNRSRCVTPNLDETPAGLVGEFFDNGLLRASKVLERKTGVRAVWKTTLAVATLDHYMHLFDLTNYPEHMMGSRAGAVFETLIPLCDMPTTDSVEVIPRTSPILKDLTPVDSVNLLNSTFHIDQMDPRCLEISATVAGRFTNVRKYVIRTTGREESKQWFDILKELGRPSTPQGQSTKERS